MGVLWDKVWRDLWENKGRTVQVVLIIAVGTFAIGMIIGTRQFMITGMQYSWRQIVAADNLPVDRPWGGRKSLGCSRRHSGCIHS